jgi:RNA polymerase sigma-70 factor (ECF subfamily)
VYAPLNHQLLTLARRAPATPNDLADAAMGRYARGDDSAFDELYRLLQPRLRRRCLALVGPNDADELLQDVLLKMHRARAAFIEQGSVVAWAYAIARTTHLDRVRRRKRRPEACVENEQLESHAAERTNEPEFACEQRALESVFLRRLEALPHTLRSAYTLVKFDGLSCADAGVVLGVSIHAVKQRVHRASEELKAAIAAC